MIELAHVCESDLLRDAPRLRQVSGNSRPSDKRGKTRQRVHMRQPRNILATVNRQELDALWRGRKHLLVEGSILQFGLDQCAPICVADRGELAEQCAGAGLWTL